MTLVISTTITLCSVAVTVCGRWPNPVKDPLVYIANPIEAEMPGHWVPASIVKAILEKGPSTTPKDLTDKTIVPSTTASTKTVYFTTTEPNIDADGDPITVLPQTPKPDNTADVSADNEEKEIEEDEKSDDTEPSEDSEQKTEDESIENSPESLHAETTESAEVTDNTAESEKPEENESTEENNSDTTDEPPDDDPGSVSEETTEPTEPPQKSTPKRRKPGDGHDNTPG